MTRTDVYRQLWKISKAFDPLLGVRGFTPSDVYAESENIIQLVRFLRVTQNLSGMPKKPKKTHGKRPNHALASAYHLQKKIHDAERNLWMPAISVPEIEKRVITPAEVHDALQTIMSELQRIKFRLGVEVPLREVAVIPNKTPDDVIQNLEWAAAAMPQFPFDRKLRQYDPASLRKNFNDIYSIAQNILKELKAYKKTRGIRVKASTPPLVKNIKPRHVYQKTLESLKKMVELRRQSGFASSAAPFYLMRPITFNDVYVLAARLDTELHLLSLKATISRTQGVFEEFEQKTPSDVFRAMWSISYELDTILGTQGQTPDDVFQVVIGVEKQVQALAKHLGYTLKEKRPELQLGLTPEDVFLKSKKVLKIITLFQKRLGFFTTAPPTPDQNEKVTHSDVFNTIGIISAELTDTEV